jgi:uncharacterized Fe-S cluster-containing radical SAM superfamily enzyme
MANVSFEQLSFRDDTNHPGEIRVDFMNTYYFYIEKDELSRVGSFELCDDGSIDFDCSETKALNKLNRILADGFQDLTHRNRHKDALYVHQNSGIPLIGTNEFGIVDRGSNILEVKPLTGCNMSCVFCSVKEGKNNKSDIVVEEEYLVQEFRKLAKIKDNPIEANIGPQGEPLLYPRLVDLVRDLNDVPNVEVVSMNSNGVTLSPWLIDRLADAGLDRINLSIHGNDPERAEELMDEPYDVEEVKEKALMCEGKIDVLLAPVLVPGYNEDQMDGLIEFAKTIENERFPTIGIQNYLNYKHGRNITDQMPWEEFYEWLNEKEDEHDMSLRMTTETFDIVQDNTLDRPFRKGDRVDVELLADGRRGHETLGRAGNRCVTVLHTDKTNGTENVRLIRDKHNVFTGVADT